MTTAYRCWAEVDLDALRANLAWLRHRVGPRVKIMTVVKADAYGHGLKQIAALLMQSGTDIFGVANLAEARAIRSVGRGWPILMLGACLPDEIETCVKDHVMPTISTLAEAHAFAAAARKLRRNVEVHLKVDTGMGRLGVAPADALALARAISGRGAHPPAGAVFRAPAENRRGTQSRETSATSVRAPEPAARAQPATPEAGCAPLPSEFGLKLQGLFTHFSSAEDAAEFSAQQAALFHSVIAQLTAAGLTPPMIHANNSAAILHEPATTFDLVRPGLLVYGILPTGRRRALPPLPELRPALSWHCRVALVKEIPKGTPLSYGHTFTAPRRMRVATLTAGYGDGYLRAGSERAAVLIHGRRCAVLGRVTMDQMLVDVTRVPATQPGDVATFIGRQGTEEITATEVATWFGTIPWEVLTAITYRVPRIYRGGSAA